VAKGEDAFLGEAAANQIGAGEEADLLGQRAVERILVEPGPLGERAVIKKAVEICPVELPGPWPLGYLGRERGQDAETPEEVGA
jgi:hypothetical protein